MNLIKMLVTSVFGFFFCALPLCSFAQEYEVLEQSTAYPSAFTQGFERHKPLFYSSSGGYGKSFVALYDSANTLKKYWPAPRTVFLEGLTVWDNRIYVLTWKSGTVYALDQTNLNLKKRFKITGQGWGLSHDSEHFIVSDGSTHLRFMNRQFVPVKTLRVHDNGRPLTRINELEYAKGAIWANVWKRNTIYKISPETGAVLQHWDMSALTDKQGRLGPEAVLNGIAYDKEKDAFWITGKLWPTRYLVRFK